MKAKRKIKMSVATNRRFTIRQTTRQQKQIACKICGGPMLNVEQVAVFFDVNQRLIFIMIEQNKLHFAEIEAQVVMVCISSMAEVLNEILPDKLLTEEKESGT